MCSAVCLCLHMVGWEASQLAGETVFLLTFFLLWNSNYIFDFIYLYLGCGFRICSQRSWFWQETYRGWCLLTDLDRPIEGMVTKWCIYCIGSLLVPVDFKVWLKGSSTEGECHVLCLTHVLVNVGCRECSSGWADCEVEKTYLFLCMKSANDRFYFHFLPSLGCYISSNYFWNRFLIEV